MKTSKIIILSAASLMLTILAITLLILRKDMNTIIENRSMLRFKEVPVEIFDKLNLSSNWIVRIKQGKKHKVEIARKQGVSVKPQYDVIDSTLYLAVKRSHGVKTDKVYAHVTSPTLQFIKAKGNTSIEMNAFWWDSVVVFLEDSSAFTGNNLDFEKISFKACGDVK